MEPFKVIGTQSCPFCLRAKSLLENKELPHGYIDITHDEERRRELKSAGYKTVPQIWHGEAYIGGFEQLVSYLESQDGL